MYALFVVRERIFIIAFQEHGIADIIISVFIIGVEFQLKRCDLEYVVEPIQSDITGNNLVSYFIHERRKEMQCFVEIRHSLCTVVHGEICAAPQSVRKAEVRAELQGLIEIGYCLLQLPGVEQYYGPMEVVDVLERVQTYRIIEFSDGIREIPPVPECDAVFDMVLRHRGTPCINGQYKNGEHAEADGHYQNKLFQCNRYPAFCGRVDDKQVCGHRRCGNPFLLSRIGLRILVIKAPVHNVGQRYQPPEIHTRSRLLQRETENRGYKNTHDTAADGKRQKELIFMCCISSRKF